MAVEATLPKTLETHAFFKYVCVSDFSNTLKEEFPDLIFEMVNFFNFKLVKNYSKNFIP